MHSPQVVLSCKIVKNLKYNQATPTFHQWRDSRTIYGLNFPTPDDAEKFASGIKNALEILARDGQLANIPRYLGQRMDNSRVSVPDHITQSVPPPSQPPALPPRKMSMHGQAQADTQYINVDDTLIEKIREKDAAMTHHLYGVNGVGNGNSEHGRDHRRSGSYQRQEDDDRASLYRCYHTP